MWKGLTKADVYGSTDDDRMKYKKFLVGTLCHRVLSSKETPMRNWTFWIVWIEVKKKINISTKKESNDKD